jgi:hypothetical protein
MHRSLATRLLAAFVAVWFTINMVEPAWLHSCPVHDGLLVTTAANHHTGGQSHASHQRASHDESNAPAESHHCSCLGVCTAAAIVSAPVSPLTGTADHRAAAPGLPEYHHPVLDRAHELPFANGPPLA